MATAQIVLGASESDGEFEFVGASSIGGSHEKHFTFKIQNF